MKASAPAIMAVLLMAALATPASARDPCDSYMDRQVTLEAAILRIAPLRNGSHAMTIRGKVGACAVDWIAVDAGGLPASCAVGRTVRATGTVEFDGIDILVTARRVSCR
jgi:hypothetical protein